MSNTDMTVERLRELYGHPSGVAATKVNDHLNAHCRDFIKNSSFLVLATSDGTNLDASPKGDPAGFVFVEDDHHIILPDRAGNNRIDGLINLLNNPNVGMVFLIPTVNETLRINGVATIIDDPEICAKHAAGRKIPKTVLRIKIKEAFIHCGIAPRKGSIWKPAQWPTERPIATVNEMFKL